MKNESIKGEENNARINPLPMNIMRPEWIKTLEKIPGAGLKGLYAPVNVLGTLMHNPRTLGPFLEYWVNSKLEMGFSVCEQELIILRMGVHYNCDYVWKHHVPVAQEYGVNDEEIAAVKANPLPDVFSTRETALLQLTDELVVKRTISKHGWEKWSLCLSYSELVDLVSIVSQYVLFALTNNAMNVQIEKPLNHIPGI